MAPKRFAIAINQAPLRRRGPWPFVVDWVLDRITVGRIDALPPAHLARQVLEESEDFEGAVRHLMGTEVALPAFFTVSGTEPGQGCVIEHLGDRAIRYDGPEAVANDWLSEGLRGKPRGKANAERRALMAEKGQTTGETQMDWVAAPILNKYTRLAAVMNAATREFAVMGYEKDGPATEMSAVSSAAPTAHPGKDHRACATRRRSRDADERRAPTILKPRGDLPGRFAGIPARSLSRFRSRNSRSRWSLTR